MWEWECKCHLLTEFGTIRHYQDGEATSGGVRRSIISKIGNVVVPSIRFLEDFDISKHMVLPLGQQGNIFIKGFRDVWFDRGVDVTREGGAEGIQQSLLA